MKSIQMNTVVCSFFFSSFSPVCISWNIKLKNQNTKNVVTEKREENEIKYAPWKLDLLALLRFNFSLVFFLFIFFSWARLCAVFFIGLSPLFKWDCQLIWFDIYELFFYAFPLRLETHWVCATSWRSHSIFSGQFVLFSTFKPNYCNDLLKFKFNTKVFIH